MVDWYSLLSQSGYPVAYNHFPQASEQYKPPDPPYVIWLIQNSQVGGADEKNMLSTESVRVELYTDTKDQTAEEKIESLLNQWPYDKTEIWIPEEKMYLISYEMTILRRL